MTTSPPTDQAVRERAATALDTSFLIEAGAGTGKTRLIIDRLVALIRSGIPLERIVAITYTEKAASEMKLRLRDRLQAMRGPSEAEGHDADPVIEAALHVLEGASVSTIHAFCSGLLRQHPVEADVDPAFRVADEAEAEVLRDEAWQTSFAALLETAPAEIDRALTLGLAPGAVEPVLRLVARPLERRDAPVPAAVPEPTEALLGTAQARLAEVTRSMKALGVDAQDKLAVEVRRMWSENERLLALPAIERDRELLACRVLRGGSVGNKAKWRKDEAALDEARRLVRAASDDRLEAAGAIGHNVARGWIACAGGYRDAYARRKRGASVLDFDDLLEATRRLLEGHEAVRQRIAAQFDAIIVDEFQDTDPVQADIVRRLGLEGSGAAPRRVGCSTPAGRAFVVGDPKQSIYAFRGADIEAYTAFREALRAAGGAIESITNSFRPTRPLLELANEIAGRLFPSPATDLQPSYDRLTGGDAPADARPSIVVLAPSRPPEPVADEPSVAEDGGRPGQAEAAAVAALIREALDEGWTIRDRHHGPRRIREGDVAILLPAMTGPLERYEQALQAHRIPYLVSGGKRFYRSVEVTALQCAVAAIDDPGNRLALVAALRSPLFGLSDDAIVQRAASGHGLSLLDPSGDDEVAPALRLLRKLHDDRHRWSPARILSALLDQTGVLGAFALKPDGMQQVQNLLKLVDEARRLADSGRLTFRRLARMLAERVEGEHAEAESPAAEAGDGAVEILTVHKSKGLEFGMVVLGGLAHSGRVDAPRAVVDRGLVQGLVKRNELELATSGFAASQEVLRRRQEAERTRLLYVALTRPRDYLVIPTYAYRKNPGGLLSPLAQAVPELAVVLEGGTIERIGPVPIDVRRVEPRAIEDLPRHRIAPARLLAAEGSPDRDRWSEERARLLRAASAPFTHRAPSHLHAADSDVVEGGRLPGPGGADLGTAVHRALQAADLGDAEGAAALATHHARAMALGPEAEARARALVQSALDSPLLCRAREASRLWRELPFVLPIEGGVVEGSIDLCFEEAAGLVVVDYKTDQIREAAVGARMKAHRVQLAVYALALGQITGRAVREVNVLFLAPGVVRSLTVTPALLAEARGALGTSPSQTAMFDP